MKLRAPTPTEAMRISLWVLLVPASLLAFEYLLVGLVYGFALWDVRHPEPTLLWLAVISFPILLVLGLRATRSRPDSSGALFAVAWLVAAGLIWWVLRPL